MKKQTRKTPSYLDVAQFILSGPFSPKISPAFTPIQHEPIDVIHISTTELRTISNTALPFTNLQNMTPLSRPLYIQVPQGQPSPYLKQLLSKVGGAQVQFFDFTLQDPNSSQEELDNQQFEQQSDQKQMSVINQEEQQEYPQIKTINHKNTQTLQCSSEEYIPNMHLLDIHPSAFKLQHFEHALEGFQSSSQQQKREFISLYLTDDDLDLYKDAQLATLVKVVRINLVSRRGICRLQRKAKVSRYLQKKKRRIWKKKINYDCRKKVADNRLRLKGKFVTPQQACVMLGIQLCSQQELRELLRNNYQQMMF